MFIGIIEKDKLRHLISTENISFSGKWASVQPYHGYIQNNKWPEINVHLLQTYGCVCFWNSFNFQVDFVPTGILIFCIHSNPDKLQIEKVLI